MTELHILASPRISRAGFCAVLNAARSPARDEAAAMYDACVVRRADSCVLLAFFRHESQFGTDPNAVTITAGKNAGALRAGPRAYQIRRGFAWYRTWTAGVEDWADLMVRYAARGVVTVEQTAPIYAPASDNNSPPAYIAAVRADVARWRARYPVEPPAARMGRVIFDGARVRSAPRLDAPILATLRAGAAVTIDHIIADGAPVPSADGSRRWARVVTPRDGYMVAGYMAAYLVAEVPDAL